MNLGDISITYCYDAESRLHNVVVVKTLYLGGEFLLYSFFVHISSKLFSERISWLFAPANAEHNNRYTQRQEQQQPKACMVKTRVHC